MARHATTDENLLAMALVGYEAEMARIDAAIVDIQAKLGTTAGAPAQSVLRKRTLSAAARKRIAAAQRKRWAAVKKSQAQGESAATVKAAAPKKRTMSAAGRKRIAEATRKRWAAYRKGAAKKTKPAAKAAVKKAPTAAAS